MKALSLVTLLIFLGVISGGTILETASVTKYFDRSRSDFREREATKELLDAMVERFGDLVALDFDDEKNPLLESIRTQYASYNLTIRDISSGINLNFLPDSFLSEPSLAKFLFSEGSAERFLGFRKSHGFDTEISAWKPFLREEALNAVVSYGWFSTLHKDTEAGQRIAVSYGNSGDGLYPLMNDMPLINVNTMDIALLAPMLSYRSWRIAEAAAKAAALKSKLEHGPLTEGELRAILALNANHEIFRYLGVRTSFWSLSFKNGRYRMDAVIAAVPEQGGKTIEYYTIIERRLSRVA